MLPSRYEHNYVSTISSIFFSILAATQFDRCNSGSNPTSFTHVCQYRDDGRALSAIHIFVFNGPMDFITSWDAFFWNTAISRPLITTLILDRHIYNSQTQLICEDEPVFAAADVRNRKQKYVSTEEHIQMKQKPVTSGKSKEQMCVGPNCARWLMPRSRAFIVRRNTVLVCANASYRRKCGNSHELARCKQITYVTRESGHVVLGE